MTNLEKYYNKFNEEHRLKTRHGIVEFTTSMKFIHDAIDIVRAQKKCENSQIKILDLGAATGAYSVPLSLEGFDVTAVELVKRNLQILRDKHENVKTWQGDARNLHFLENETFDICLIFGPLYHLLEEKERIQVFSEAIRVLKKGGFIFASYIMNEYAIIQYCFGENKMTECLEKGTLTSDFHTICQNDDLYGYVRLEDINAIKEKVGLKRVKIFAQDGAADYMRQTLNSLDEKTFSAFIDYHLAICERPELLGASSHVVDVLQK